MIETKPFDKYETRGAYHWLWYETNENYYREYVDFLVSFVEVPGSVLDIGGGDGLISFRLFERGHQVTCLDSNRVSIQLARAYFERAIYGKQGWLGASRRLLSWFGLFRSDLIRRYRAGQVTFEAASIFDIEDTARFDYVVCHEVIEHVQDPERLLQIIHRSIREYAIISTPDTTDRPQHSLDYNSWTPESFSELLKPYNFEFIKQDGWSMYVKLYK